jgi:hypothetical protein
MNPILSIGATPPHSRARQTRYAEVPCRVQTREGEWIEKCLLTFLSAPPLEDYYEKARLITDIADIEPSSYALPVPVRAATTRSQPDEKGQALTLVETSAGKRLYLNWNVNFVDRKNMKGQDFHLVESFSKSQGKKKQGKLAVIREPFETLTYFIGDWSEEIQKKIIR